MQNKVWKTLPVLLALVVLLSACAKTQSVQPIETEAPVETEAPPVCVYPALCVKAGSSVSSADDLIALARQNSVNVFAEGKCRLAAAALGRLNDIKFTYTGIDECDAAVFLPDEIPDGYISIDTLQLAVWIPPNAEQEAIYSELEAELKDYM